MGRKAVVMLLLPIELGDVFLALVALKLFTVTCLNSSLAVELTQTEKEKHWVWSLQRYYISVKSSRRELRGSSYNSLN